MRNEIYDQNPSVAGDGSPLAAALEHANIPTLLMVLAQLTGDDAWLAEPYRPKRGKPLDDNDSGGLAPETQAEIRQRAFEAILAYRSGTVVPVLLTPDRVAQMLAVSFDEMVPAEYGPMLSEELGVLSRDVPVPSAPAGGDFRILIIGAGLSGLAMAIKLKAAGIAYTIIEKNPRIGGTWLENTYPGVGVDTPSHLYTFSFAPSTHWNRYFALGDQVEDYLERLATDYDVCENVRFSCEVQTADYDADSALWEVVIRTPQGIETLSCNVLISAVGMVNRPAIPNLPGLDSFVGPAMHTAQWRSDVDLAGKRVAVIGTGASAMQLVPAVVNDAERVMIFQRSKQWALPHPRYRDEVSDGTRYLMEHVPYYLAWYRLRAFWNFTDRLHAALQIDPEWPQPDRSINQVNENHRIFLTDYVKQQLGERQDLLHACLPDYPPYGKRPLIDNGWFKTICRDDVDLITDQIAEIRPNSVVTADGTEYEVDALVLATGFKTLKFLWPMAIRGKSGKTLTEVWGPDDARAYLGITVPDFPNLFILNGPNTNAGHGGSAIHPTEFQVRYIMQALAEMIARDLASVDVEPSVFDNYQNELDEALAKCIWVHPGMTTYYRNGSGRIVTASPWKYVDYWSRTKEFRVDEYVVEKSERADAWPPADRDRISS
jgi:4-hydroxyacetophenone monooxygenase